MTTPMDRLAAALAYLGRPDGDASWFKDHSTNIEELIEACEEVVNELGKVDTNMLLADIRLRVKMALIDRDYSTIQLARFVDSLDEELSRGQGNYPDSWMPKR